MRRILAVLFVVLSVDAMAAEFGLGPRRPSAVTGFGVGIAPEPGLYGGTSSLYFTGSIREPLPGGAGRIRTSGAIGLQYLSFGYVLPEPVLGSRFAFGAALPIAYDRIDARIETPAGVGRQKGEGWFWSDPVLTPWALWFDAGPAKVVVSQAITAPWGDYSSERIVNGSAHVWRVSTNLAASFFTASRAQELGLILSHTWNSEDTTTRYTSGQEFTLEAMANQYLSPTFGIGAHLYYTTQITGDRGAGATFGSFKGHELAVGPALFYQTAVAARPVILGLKYLGTVAAENRVKGHYLLGNFVFKF